MNKKLVFLAMLVSLPALSLVFVACDNETSPGGGGETGTFRIKITDIPTSVMNAGKSGQNLIGLYPANTSAYTTSNALAGRDTAQSGDDSSNSVFSESAENYYSNWYEFSMYKTSTPGEKYTGPAGNYDIAFKNKLTLAGKVIKNTKLEVNATNTFSYNDFGDDFISP
jgi:hypothetical protein